MRTLPEYAGQVIDPRDERIAELEEQMQTLTDKLDYARRQLAQAQVEATHATRNLRKQLSPLYRALQEVFGELDTIGGGGDNEAAAPASHQAYEQWKRKLGAAEGRIIDALLAHGPMDSKALVIATGYHRTTLPRPIAKLRQAGLLLTRDGKYVLREL